MIYAGDWSWRCVWRLCSQWLDEEYGCLVAKQHPGGWMIATAAAGAWCRDLPRMQDDI